MKGHNKVRFKVSDMETEETGGVRVRRLFPSPHLSHIDSFVD